ncbi:MAG: ABC transporter substrate-binding protein [Alphaproteobacteria bacterium]|nr:ABC transporter substrate-binding protein [Alphaproteobacteria bacterium]
MLRLGGAGAVGPFTARAQRTAMPVVGYLSNGSRDAFAPYVGAFLGGLREAGFDDGRNVAIEYRWIGGQFSRVSALVAELIDRKPDVLVMSEAALRVVPAGLTIPIVALFAADPVKYSNVASYSRPGGGVTGVQMFTYELGTKRLQLLREIVPSPAAITVLANPANPVPAAKDDLGSVVEFARAAGQRIEILGASTPAEIDAAFAVMAERRAAGLLVMGDPFFNSRREQIIGLAARHAIPALYEWRQFTEVGGFVSYGASFTDTQHQMGRHAGAILKGAKPAELPIVQTVKVELIINMKTARTLGIEIPQSLSGRADEVIE